MSYRTAWKPAMTIAALVTALCAGGAPGAAQEATPGVSPAALDGASVVVYDGSCGESLDQPLRELGTLEHQTVIEDTEAGLEPEADQDAERGVRLRGEDINGNGVLDEGEDRNGNGQLDPGLLEHEEAVPESALMITNVPEVWMLDSSVDLDTIAPADQVLAMAIQHGAGEARRLLACGELQRGTPTEETGPLFITLEPVSGADAPAYRGFARLASGSDGATGGTRVVMFETPAAEEQGQSQGATPAP